jgi:hypothetical protein
MFLVTSSLVRGENMRFRGECDRDVISRVRLPWLNVVQSFVGQVTLLDNIIGSVHVQPACSCLNQRHGSMDSWSVSFSYQTCESRPASLQVPLRLQARHRLRLGGL